MQTVSNWRAVKLRDVCALRTESVDPANAMGLAYVGLEHIDSGKPSLTRCGSPTEVRSLKNRFRRGDILYGKLRPYLDKAVCANYEGICSTDILVFKAEPTVHSSFLIHVVHTPTFVEHAVKTTKGVNHPRTSWHSLSAFEFRLPPTEEQEAIARALDALQKAKDTRRHELAVERERKSALMEQLFTHGTHMKSRIVRRTSYGEVPADWRDVALDSCAFIQTGVAKGRKLAGADVLSVPYLRVANVQDGHLDLAEMKTIAIRHSELNRYRLQDGDVVLTEGGDFNKLGRGFIWHDEVKPCVHQNHIFAVRPNRELLSPEYLAYLAQSPYGKSYFLSVAHKTTNLACINKTKLGKFPVLIPTLEEQASIVKTLRACDAKAATLVRETEVIDEVFRVLLEGLMTGRISSIPLVEEHQPR